MPLFSRFSSRHASCRWVGLTLWLLTVAGLPGSAAACPYDLPTTTVRIGAHTLTVEVAATPRAQACGLSRRLQLDDDRGMLFVFPRPEMQRFWMKHTWIPLSIAFLDAAGTIINIADMRPDQTEETYGSHRPAAYALEVHQGWFRLRGIQPGDRVIIGGRRPAQP